MFENLEKLSTGRVKDNVIDTIKEMFDNVYAKEYKDTTGWDPLQFGFEHGMDPNAALWAEKKELFVEKVIGELKAL